MNTPRFPAPCFVEIEMVDEPFPSILNSESPMFKLFPFPACVALMIRVPIAFDIENVAVPVSRVTSLWLRESVLGLREETHGGGKGVGVGVA